MATRLLSGIRMRDPFVLSDGDGYFLYGTTDPDPWAGPGTGFDVYRSADLEHWDGPLPAFRPPAGFWGETQFWAPEVYRFGDRYAMLATFAGSGARRGTQVLVADAAVGPFRPWSVGAVTPPDWECLDGTLHVDDRGDPWIVFCHEWVQLGDGAIAAQRLSADLSAAVGAPLVLFHASEAPWARPLAPDPEVRRDAAFVTDGPFLWRSSSGSLMLLWSSFGEEGYAMGIARSVSGEITGPWRHDPEPLWPHDGGHGMVLDAQDGRRFLVFHRPNRSPLERPVMLPLREIDGAFAVVDG